MTYFFQLLGASMELVAPVAIGAGLGAAGAGLGRRRSGSRVATAALIGSVVGLAWASRDSAAIRKINAARDLHWLEKNPVAYG
jgi:hypothetical protein